MVVKKRSGIKGTGNGRKRVQMNDESKEPSKPYQGLELEALGSASLCVQRGYQGQARRYMKSSDAKLAAYCGRYGFPAEPLQ